MRTMREILTLFDNQIRRPTQPLPTNKLKKAKSVAALTSSPQILRRSERHQASTSGLSLNQEGLASQNQEGQLSETTSTPANSTQFVDAQRSEESPLPAKRSMSIRQSYSTTPRKRAKTSESFHSPSIEVPSKSTSQPGKSSQKEDSVSPFSSLSASSPRDSQTTTMIKGLSRAAVEDHTYPSLSTVHFFVKDYKGREGASNEYKKLSACTKAEMRIEVRTNERVFRKSNFNKNLEDVRREQLKEIEWHMLTGTKISLL